MTRKPMVKTIMMLSAAALSIAATASTQVAAQVAAQVAPQAAPAQFKDFRTFMQEVQSAPATSYVGAPGSNVRDAAALEEMRAHILRMYSGMPVVNSFEHDGQTFDCVAVMAQPSVRLRGMTQLASPPSTLIGPNRNLSDATRPQIPPLSFDAHGNLKGCTSSLVPIRRVTLEETSRFETLADFFQKGPKAPNPAAPGQATPGQATPPGGNPSPGKDQSPGSEDPCSPAPGGDCHAHAYGYQYVTNYGVSSTFEVWNPSVGPDQVFSLSQLWILNPNGAKGMQSVESGWQVFPGKYNTSNAVLFIFATPDGYQTGCYNHDCANFVQVNNSVYLGGGFTSYSTIVNGTKHAETMRLSWWLYQGNWWLGYGSTWVGYYPGSLYNVGQGPSLQTGSSLIEFGGETVGGIELVWAFPPRIVPTWPQMGNGYFSSSPSLAAQQNGIYYLTSTGGSSAWSSLTGSSDTLTSCYTSAVSGTTLIFGGSGGVQAC
jgi:hypothetical protein